MARNSRGLSDEDAEVWRLYTEKLLGDAHPRPVQAIIRVDDAGGVLDLHGYPLQDAWVLFSSFVDRHMAKGSRHAIVVTGGSGRMREEFEHWCSSKAGVASCEPIRSRGGKIGSFRIGFRRS
jgi:predicted Rossmann-fold nucleotide-binding protein